MIETFRCDDKETLVAYLYGEIDAEARREVERHLRSCAACARETEALQSVREDLASWLPPEPELGFTMVAKSADVLRPSRWALPALPVWAQVAAAVLVFAVGAAIANIQVRYGRDGVTVTTGWMGPAAPVTTDALPATRALPAALPESQALNAVPVATDQWRAALSTLEQDLRNEMAELRRTAAPAVRASDATVDQTAIMRRVQELLDASEQRQRQEMALRITQAGRDWDVKRQTDLLRINHDFSTLQGRAFKTEAGQRDVINYLRRVSAQPIP